MGILFCRIDSGFGMRIQKPQAVGVSLHGKTGLMKDLIAGVQQERNGNGIGIDGIFPIEFFGKRGEDPRVECF